MLYPVFSYSKYIYIWKKEYYLKNIFFIVNNNDILLLSLKKNNLNDFYVFCNTHFKYHKIIPLISNNYLIFNKNRKKYFLFLRKIIKILEFKEINLDVEPYQLKFYKNNRTKLYIDYINMVKCFKKNFSNTKIDITIPYFLYKHIKEEKYIKQNIYKIFLMLYNTEKIKKIMLNPNKYLNKLNIKNKNIVIVIKIKNFQKNINRLINYLNILNKYNINYAFYF